MAEDKSGADWDAYWRGMHQASAYGAGGVQQGALDRFWRDLFLQTCPSTTHPRVLDLACGHGAVARQALGAAAAANGPVPAIFCLDISAAAIAELRRNVAGVAGVAASAAKTPFSDAAFDVVASQFGLEYAGRNAFSEAVRLVAAKGFLAIIVHLKDGAFHRECARNVEAANAILASGVLSMARAAFVAGFAVRDRRGAMSEFQQASEAMVPAVRALGDLLRRYGENCAGGTAKGLYRDLGHMYRRLNAYDEGEVLGWLSGMEREIGTYIGRMSSMTAVAIDAVEFEGVVQEVVRRGFGVRAQGPMRLDFSPDPAAWMLVAQAP